METASSSKSSNRCPNSSTSSSSCSLATRESKRNGVTGPRTPSDVHHDTGKVLHAYKLMRIDQKQKIYRIFGVCKENPTYNVISVEDRRLTTTIPTIYNKKKSVPTDFHLPKFTIDVNYRVIPPKREFSITGLNDNVDERFLQDLCKKGPEPCEVVVLYDPHTRKHLGMAFMDFDAKWKSDAFIAKHNGKAMMGSVITCFFDPMAYKISRIYEEITGMALELPKRYFDLKSTKAITDMRLLLHQRYNEKGTCPHFSYKACTSTEIDKEVDFDLLQRRESDGDVVDDNHNSQTYRLANGRSTPASNHTSPAPVLTPTPVKTPKFCEAPPTLNAFFHKNPDESPSNTSIHDGGVYSHTRVSQRDACAEDFHMNTSTPSLQTASPLEVKSPNKKTTVIKRKHRTHRWSSSSESGSSDDDESRWSYKAKKLLNNLNDLPQQTHPLKKNTNGSISVVSLPQSLSFQTSSPLMPNRLQQQSRTSESRRIKSPHTSYLNSNNGFSAKCGVGFSSAPSGAGNVVRLPPPGIIESPQLASGVIASTRSNITSIPSTSSQFYEFSPTKVRNLEQRLVQIFGKGPSSNSQGTPSTNTPTSSSSSCAPLSIVPATVAVTTYYQQPPSTSITYESSGQYDIGQPSFTAYVPPAERRNKSQMEIDSDLQKRINAEQIRERQEKMLRCCDTSRKVRSVMSMDLFIIMKKDLFRRLDSEAFKLLDAEIEEQKKHQVKNAMSHQEVKVEKPTNDTRLMSIFPHFDNVDDMNVDSIFGMPYTVRMSAMPSFKKKTRVEVKKFTIPPVEKSRMANNKSYKFETNRIQEKKVEKHKKRQRSVSVESDTYYKHQRHEKKERTEKKKKKRRHRKSRSPSRSTCATADDSVTEMLKVADEDDFDEEMKEKPASSGNVSPHASSSDSDGEKDDDDVTVEDDESTLLDERERRLRDAEIGAQEEGDENVGKKSLSEKRAILNSLLRDSTTSNEQTPPVEDIMVEIVATDPAKLMNLNKVYQEEEERSMQTSEESDVESAQGEVPFIAAKPPSSKKPRFERQLDSLLNGNVFIKPPKPTIESRIWSKRSEIEDLGILNDLQETPINEEDCAYLKVAFMRLWDYFDGMMPDDRKLIWIQPTIPRVPQELPSKVSRDNCEFYYDDPELDGVVPHQTGCARTEGYYKVSRQRKRLLRQFDNEMVRTVISSQDETAVRHKTQASKDERAMNRRLKTWIGDSNLIRVNQLKYRGKMIKFARSRIHGWGLYALENIMPEDMIIEYVGEKIRPTVADEREKNYERRGMGSSYMFRIDGDAVIDATKKGNYGRFINHSCMPNCTARVVMVDGEKRIVIYSKRLIQRGEEITYDYKFAREDEASKIECLCGARTCHKYLN